jgi:hypothetical protein
MKSTVIKDLEPYTGKHILPHTVEVVRDTFVPGTYAVQWQHTKKEVIQFLWRKDGGADSIDRLEEVTFNQWPPRKR